jgi:hypothetical protein
MPAGAVFPLLVWVVLTPAKVRAGCSYGVISRYDRALIASFPRDTTILRADAATPAPPLSKPRSPSPCQAEWCGDRQPAPAVPAGTLPIRADSWAWFVAVADPVSLLPSHVFDDAADLHPSRCVEPVFRPPRLFARA